MARPIALLTPEAVESAVEYLQRALERNPQDFLQKPVGMTQALAALDRQLSQAPKDRKPDVFRDWVTSQLTDQGRVRMLNAIRRKRADARRPASNAKARVLRLPEEATQELDRLTEKTGLPTPKLVAALAAIGNVDERLRAQLVKLAVATSLKPRKLEK